MGFSVGLGTKEYCVAGWSYGGYAALMTTLKDKENVVCTVSINGVTDVGYLIDARTKDFPIYAYWSKYIGDLFETSDADFQEISPLDRASEFSAPALLIHGTEDLIVPVAQARQLKSAWENKANTQLIEIKGDDHQLETTSSRKKLLSETIRFLNANHSAK